MTFRDLLAQFKTLKFEESRAETEHYFEVVIGKAGLEDWNKALTGYFGPPLKPAGHSPSGLASRPRAAPTIS